MGCTAIMWICGESEIKVFRSARIIQFVKMGKYIHEYVGVRIMRKGFNKGR